MEPAAQFEQDIFKKTHPPIHLTTLSPYTFTEKRFSTFLATAGRPAVIGVAPAFGPHGVVKAIALASPTDVLVLKLGYLTTSKSGRPAKLDAARKRLASQIFRNASVTKIMFQPEILASALHLDLQLRVCQTLDLFVLSTSEGPPTVVNLLSQLLDNNSFDPVKAHRLFRDEKCNLDDPSQLAMRAWVLQATARAHGMHRMVGCTKLDTRYMDKHLLAALSKLARHAYRLDALKPLVSKNDVKGEFEMKKGKLHVESTRFKTRLQHSRTQTIHVKTTHNGKDMSYVGSASRVKGRAGIINLNGTVVGENLSITTVGKDPLTAAQRLRQEIISLAFHGKTSLRDLPFFSAIWSYVASSSASPTFPPLPLAPSIDYSGSLNGSQKTAVHSILSPDIRSTMICGAPGSGKTSVIAAAVNSMSNADPERGIWLLAQSNVAVKNIAEKLAKIGFLKFRLLVSENFHFEWHEHLYESIESNVIRSDEIPEFLTAMEQKLLGTKVILCTLSMMSSSSIPLLAKLAPVQTVIIDEASQIEMGDYIPLLHEFRKTLAKLVFIGDDKQLAPYGQEDIPDLQSIFEVSNLRADAVFLDTSYRMPTVICNFISRQIYDGRLKSKHNLHSKNACRFVNVDRGKEEKSGHSWINQEEVHMVIRIARRFLNEGKSFRIITGYDAQRTALENTMKSEGLNWEDKCFNVDSFQGNEDDYIIISVNIFKKDYPPIPFTTIPASALTSEHSIALLSSLDFPAVVGVAPAFGANGILKAVAFASSNQVLILRMGKKGKPKAGQSTKLSGRDRLAVDILMNPAFTKVVFRSEVLASALYLDYDLRVAQTLDLFSLTGSQECPTIVALLSRLLGEPKFDVPKARHLFRDEKYDTQGLGELAMRAWVAQIMAVTYGVDLLAKADKLNNVMHHTQSLTTLSSIVRHAHKIDSLKPHMTKNDVNSDFQAKDGKIHVQNTRFRTRLQISPTQIIHVETTHMDKRMTYEGKTKRVSGRAATIDLKQNVLGKNISITTIGKDPATRAEKERQSIVWSAMHRRISLENLPFFSKIWPYPKSTIVLPPLPPTPSIKASRLNASQETAVRTILSAEDGDRLVVVQGPPGTGKTTVISAAVDSMSKASPERGIWLLAQSNVAVKNIAEKLADIDFLNFRLLVSEGFHFDWHEHLYEKIASNVIRSDEFPADIVGVHRKLLDARVILCTLSMMSSLKTPLFARVAPVQTVIIDEASQIEIGNYIPLLHKFRHSLAKLVFIGDDKQRLSWFYLSFSVIDPVLAVPPYGQEDIPELRSVFEVPHLRRDPVFLDTSYRMPTVIGNFISSHIYDGRLQTVHELDSWDTCRFVDISKGKEEKSGHSWVNQEEVRAVIHIVRKFLAEGKSFRIVTGYDAQRNALENAMKVEDLPWEDKCFNVDSFQGNEDDYIIISVVRTRSLGFLGNRRRSNVMLSRCKRGMIICSSRGFLNGPGSSSLIGQLAAECGDEAWLTRQQILNGQWEMAL
ncbi:hypothetical protein EVG20_g4292 [Dentipellis fragilis]|uniref:DNA2/NAM7 helicase-like C-terminal domain-containing protein n=1 Tax=Dentipellis fragilis TaxID=205917 RepID=A0A4Y9Z0A5_9AGAM|nr:hypothetical protein EVG20_g4292 [Dentipellis fragilis]